MRPLWKREVDRFRLDVKLRFKTPWGLASHRMMDVGLLAERDGVVVWKRAKGTPAGG